MLGVNLDKGSSWKPVATLVREAYGNVAPASLTKPIGTSAKGCRISFPEERAVTTSVQLMKILSSSMVARMSSTLIFKRADQLQLCTPKTDERFQQRA